MPKNKKLREFELGFKKSLGTATKAEEKERQKLERERKLRERRKKMGK